MLGAAGGALAGGALTHLAPSASPAPSADPLPPGGSGRSPGVPGEPNAALALLWWGEQRQVWTPIGWKDHLFRFNVLYDGTVLCEPGPAWAAKPNVEPYRDRNFQLGFVPWPNGIAPALPDRHYYLYREDMGVGLQGWDRAHVAPVLWTEHRLQEGLVFRQWMFAHIPGGKDVQTAVEPLYAWIRLSVEHVDERHAPASFPMAVRLSRRYVFHEAPYLFQDGVVLQARPERAPLEESRGELLHAQTSQVDDDGSGGGGGEVVHVLNQADEVRLVAGPAPAGSVVFGPGAADGIFNLAVTLPARRGARVDLLLPMLPTARADVDAELALGYDRALAEADAYWAPPRDVASITTPEPLVNEVFLRSPSFAEVIAERSPENGVPTFLTGSFAYDVLYTTPTSMVAHMFLDPLGWHEVVDRHLEVYRHTQGGERAPGPAYPQHPGYFASPGYLRAYDWLTDHGAVLLAVATHALLSGDEDFVARWREPVVAGCEFLRDVCAITDHEGVKGLMPPGVANDELTVVQAVSTQAWNYKGLTTAVRMLRRYGHPRAEEFAAFAERFRQTFVDAFRKLCAAAPTWTAPDGTRHPVPQVSFTPKPDNIFHEAFMLDSGPLVLVWAGLLPAGDELMASCREYFRVGPNTRLLGPRTNPIARPVLIHEISSCEPCYSWNIVHSWQLGERERFLEGMYSLLVAGISPHTFISNEHRHGVYGNLFTHPLLTWCVRLAVVDDEIAPDELHLLRLCPLAWVAADTETAFERIATLFGPVSLRFRLAPDHRTLTVSYQGRWRTPPKAVAVHAPPVPGLTTMKINGHAHRVTPGQPVRLPPS
ncbi:hypothetical protein LX15_001516 [Streptoalloteichus tenebrarius]|uniref:Uncharacterized protein n=2 Tax=Streptoalloteichus tenebrarius (strain ATCC 17920 / DSM 40477 / JCM 4838 / CBS 697.72 / NBRC 16177 / NCIMB 11028 / NRRL B-12390 / A12253. 1 / ISP 5477) TaxID=1933 RepID=A0ABT1HQN9_STRSD|nr:hypothetical protein [Streptoalloteichus tenebrarius]BFE99808.1 hypothetical protein GCM10020241_14840 [Streptoalloteichus tenebrarius]